jgi:hypothetical protein
MKKQNFWIQLPTQLKNDFEKIDFGTTIRKDKALKFIHILRNKGMQDNFDMLRFRELNADLYIKKIFGGRYKEEFLQLLITNNIVEVINPYKVKEFSKKYRINFKYYNTKDSFSSLSYSDRSISTDSIPIHLSNNIHSNVLSVATLSHHFQNIDLSSLRIGIPEVKKKVITDMIGSLDIDYSAIIAKTIEVVNNIDASKFKVDNGVEFDTFEVYNRFNNISSFMTKSQALSLTRKNGWSLIQDKYNFYIDDLDRYIETKKKNIYSHYMMTVEALRKGIYYINRNDTNYRLDTIFTSMCSDTLNIIKEDNGLIEIDLVNSQFAILANWLIDEDCYQFDDVKSFCKSSIDGMLYDDIAKDIKKVRSHAKKMMMIVCFSSNLFNSALKKQFKNLFPNVHDFIQGFKKSETDKFKSTLTEDQLSDKKFKKNQSRNFAITLQKRESKIFIDGLMKLLLDQGFFVLTKHDSLIIKNEDREAVVQIILNYFKIINFKATVKVEDELIRNSVSDTPNQGCNMIEYKLAGEKKEGEESASKHAMNLDDFKFIFGAELRHLEPWNRNTGEYSSYVIRNIARREGITVKDFDMDFDKDWKDRYSFTS